MAFRKFLDLPFDDLRDTLGLRDDAGRWVAEPVGPIGKGFTPEEIGDVFISGGFLTTNPASPMTLYSGDRLAHVIGKGGAGGATNTIVGDPINQIDCPFCNASYETEKELGRHLDRVHYKEMAADDVRALLYREQLLIEERTKMAARDNIVDINRDGKVDLKDTALVARYGSVERALERLYPDAVVPSERAKDIPGSGSSDLSVFGEGDYTDDVSYGFGSGGAVRQRVGSPRKTGAVNAFPKAFVERGENVSYYNRGYQGGYRRPQGKWMTVAPGTPGSFPSKINPGQYIMRRRY